MPAQRLQRWSSIVQVLDILGMQQSRLVRVINKDILEVIFRSALFLS